MKGTSLAQAYNFHKPAYLGTRQYSFENENGVAYYVQFVQKKTQFNHYIVDLSIRDNDLDEYLTTNFGNVFRVMSTVVCILIDFIEHSNHVSQIEFVPISEANKNRNRRMIVFERYARIFRKLTGWEYQITNNTFRLYKAFK